MIPVDEWRAAARHFPHQGMRIAYWLSDTGPHVDMEKPLLLLMHGFPTSSWDWSGVWPRLADRFRLAAVDMVGFGLSDKPRGYNYLLTEQATIHEAFLAETGEGAAHVLAHDYGVSVAQELMARQNEHALSFTLESVCFLNGGLFPALHRPLPIQKLAVSPIGPVVSLITTRKRVNDSFTKIFGPDTQPSPAEVDAHWAFIREQNGHRMLHRLMAYIPERRRCGARWRAAMEDGRTPFGLVNGGWDPISGRHLYDGFRAAFPDAFTRLFERIGHYPQIEAPRETADAVLAFHDHLTAKRGIAHAG